MDIENSETTTTTPILFNDNFLKVSPEYLLLEMPNELSKELFTKSRLDIQEYKTDSYILSDTSMYQLIKYQISNLMVVCQPKSEPVSNKPKLEIKSFQQAFLIPTSVKSFQRDLLIYLRGNTVGKGESFENPELSVETLKKKFVTNEKFITKTISLVGAEINGGYVINLDPKVKVSLFFSAMDALQEAGKLKTKEDSFSVKDLPAVSLVYQPDG